MFAGVMMGKPMVMLAATLMMAAVNAADPALTHTDRHARMLAASGLGPDTGACPAGTRSIQCLLAH